MTDALTDDRAALGNLAAGWYVVCASTELQGRPRRVDLFGSTFVAWRADGDPVVMPGTCPHMGAALFDGKIVDATLQCPFHHWRFDRSGRCIAVPDRLPPTRAAVTPVPVSERSGYVWAWWGTTAPTHEPPVVPGLHRRRRPLRQFRLADPTRATVRRILENTFDPDHLVALHGLTITGRTRIDWDEVAGTMPSEGPPERLDARLSWPSYAQTLGRVSTVLGLNADQFELRVQGWATCQRIEYFADGHRVYDMVLAVTPVAAGQYIQHINVSVDANGHGPAGWLRSLVHRAEVTVAARQDLPIFDTLLPGDRHGIYVPGDEALRRFRRFYHQWVEAAGEQ
jgi:nitrite reductase/ring-hydroxylating ferredoxin subunit